MITHSNLILTLIVETSVRGLSYSVEQLASQERAVEIRRWLTDSDPSTNYNSALQQRQGGTGTWFLQREEFLQWKVKCNSFLWLCGITGCGKTILSATIVQHLKESCRNQPTLYFYFDSNDTSKQSFEVMVRSLINQLYYASKDAQKPVDDLYNVCENGQSQPDLKSLCKVFSMMVEQLQEINIVLDALDECTTRSGSSRVMLFKWIRACLGSEKGNLHLLVTSRPEEDVRRGLRDPVLLRSVVHVLHDAISHDIYRYISARVKESIELERWRSRPDVQNEIELHLMAKAAGM
jgi:Cdc6-like AAA superfamily ATPase